MKLRQLQDHIRTLATLEETDSLVVSCYVNLGAGRGRYQVVLQEQAKALRPTLEATLLREFDESMRKILEYLDPLSGARQTRGAAIFTRGGKSPFFLPLEFEVELPDWLAVDTLPHIFHLIELKDTYHRFVILLFTPREARILEVNLGSVTESIWRERPELRERIDRVWSRKRYQQHFDRSGEHTWSKEQYQNQHLRLGKSFMRDMVRILDRLMSAGGHTHLVLAGESLMTNRVLAELPEHLRSKIVDIVSRQKTGSNPDVVASAIRRFIEKEEQESQSFVEELYKELQRGGLAFAGVEDSRRALAWGQVDVLVMTKQFDPGLRTREEMIRMAESKGCGIEIVNKSDLLTSLGGVGCLLRYQTESPDGLDLATSFDEETKKLPQVTS